jgi:hypothetical protein
MIGVSVTFSYDGNFDRARIEKVAADSRSMFEGMPGLRSKAFTIDEKQQRAMNFYVWDDADAAERFFSDDVRQMIVGLYGVEPEIEFSEIAQLVDNSSGSASASRS